MPSERILGQLHEIAEKNAKKKIDYNEFVKDLSKSTKIDDIDYDRFLSILLTYAKKNEQAFGRYSDGKFIVSEGIVKSAKEKIIIEKQRNQEKNKIINENDILSKKVSLEVMIIDSLIDNYSKLSAEEKSILFDSIGDMTNEQFFDYKSQYDKNVRDSEKKGIVTEQESEELRNEVLVNRVIQSGTEEDKLILTLIFEANQAKPGDKEAIIRLKNFLGQNNIEVSSELRSIIDYYNLWDSMEQISEKELQATDITDNLNSSKKIDLDQLNEIDFNHLNEIAKKNSENQRNYYNREKLVECMSLRRY